MLKKKKNVKEVDYEQNTNLINEVNNRLDEAGENIKAAAQECGLKDSDIYYDMCQRLEIIRMWVGNWMNRSTESLTKTCEEKINTINEYEQKCLNQFNTIKNEFGPSTAVIDKMIEDGMPLFLVIETNDINCDKPNVRYVFCYEFQKTDNPGQYNAYVLSSEKRDGYLMTVFAGNCKVRQMTEREFEEHYIIGRLKVMELFSEQDVVEYDNYVRNLFNGQREIIY